MYHPQVTYQADFFLDKNKDYVVAEHQDLLNASSCPFVAALFPALPEETAKSSKFSSIGSRFKVKLYLILFQLPQYGWKNLQQHTPYLFTHPTLFVALKWYQCIVSEVIQLIRASFLNVMYYVCRCISVIQNSQHVSSHISF